MNTSPFGRQGATALDSSTSTTPRFLINEAEDTVGKPIVHQGQLSEADKGYRATCEESYNITRQMLAAYAMYPDALYEI